MNQISIPTLLTLIRLFASPLVMPVFLIFMGTSSWHSVQLFVLLIFIGFASTDFFDGFLARRWQQETVLGKYLDPIADKSLLYATLIGLLVIGRTNFFFVMLFIFRELCVMGLRLIACQHSIAVPVSATAKAKTAAQSVYCTLVIARPLFAPYISSWFYVEYGSLFAALALSLVSGYWYVQSFMQEVTVRIYE